MRKLGKIKPQVPDISFFIPSLNERLSDEGLQHGTDGDSSWQPSTTVLVSVGVSGVLWAGIGAFAWFTLLR